MKWNKGKASAPDPERFPPMSRLLPPNGDTHSPRLIVDFVKHPELFARFQSEPSVVLREFGLTAADVDAANINKIVLGLMARSPSAFPEAAYNAIKQRHTETDRAKNMDNSYQFIVRYENRLNVFRDQGSSRRTTTVENQATNKTYQGTGAVDEPAGGLVSSSFFPGQPLVSPDLIVAIKAKLAAT